MNRADLKAAAALNERLDQVTQTREDFRVGDFHLRLDGHWVNDQELLSAARMACVADMDRRAEELRTKLRDYGIDC